MSNQKVKVTYTQTKRDILEIVEDAATAFASKKNPYQKEMEVMLEAGELKVGEIIKVYSDALKAAFAHLDIPKPKEIRSSSESEKDSEFNISDALEKEYGEKDLSGNLSFESKDADFND